MPWLRTIVLEAFGLFVDDGAFAIAIIAWLGLAWAILPHVEVSTGWRCSILFAGLAVILCESALRHARRRRGT